MSRVKSGFFSVAILAGVGLSACSGTSQDEASGPPELIPRDVLFGNPEREAAELSPNGEKYAYLAPDDGVMNVWVARVGEEGKPVTKNRTRDLLFYFWAPDGKHICYMSDNDGDENWALHSVNIETGHQRAITPSDGVQAKILAVDPNYPDQMLIELNKRNPLAHDVYRLDIATGRTTMIAENPGNVRFWIKDTKLRVRGMHLSNQDGSFDFMVRDDEDSEWRKVAHWDLEDAITSRPIGFSADDKYAYLLDSRGSDMGRLCQLDLASGEIETLYEDKEYDVGDVFGVELMRHPQTGDLQAIWYEKARRAWKVLDPSIGEDLSKLKTLHDGDFWITSRSHDDRKWFIGYQSATGPAAYYAYDRDSKDAVLLFESNPKLKDYTLADMEPIKFKARDGLEVEGYISFPPGVPRKNLPLVVQAHGGPWWRDSYGYDPERQLMTNRGYAVLNVNFRGSTTYGKTFINAANHEWGRKMLWDLVDGAEWAIDKGYADRGRIGIMGWSFGGYQALCAAAFTPDFFTCAIDGVGVANLETFMNAFPPQWETRKPRFFLRGAHPERDHEMMRERSPFHHADKIKIPMLITQGAHDPRVKQAESDQIVAKLQENGVEHKYLLFENEGHGLGRPENRETFYAEAEAFLAKHLGGRQQEKTDQPLP
ncbi:MAG: S9 family peptidase [Candidatus Eisenbacteria bacterium]|uniref:S9 family peptidase n=1 Tax=Eiseniibacteriota bacterium TaxID=2212470 RepID=A0A7Y2E860_UNCEI|nr:S9 family peptidase [Candidatus Eisenbacteria bacterium]